VGGVLTISILVPAAGCGARAGLGANKILAPLCGRPLLSHTLESLLTCACDELLVAARAEEFERVREAAGELSVRLQLVEGGATRQDSVENMARAAMGDFVLVHDAARPLVSADLITRVCEAAFRTGAAIAALPATDTVKRAILREDGAFIAETLPREAVWLAQTPQVFKRELLLRALHAAARDGFAGTDCASLVERLEHPVALVRGETRNLKVTYADDLARAEQILSEKA
jgi:2-C-methyl-D-erythritol 4-phosphate cytidylyltransferase